MRASLGTRMADTHSSELKEAVRRRLANTRLRLAIGVVGGLGAALAAGPAQALAWFGFWLGVTSLERIVLLNADRSPELDARQAFRVQAAMAAAAAAFVSLAVVFWSVGRLGGGAAASLIAAGALINAFSVGPSSLRAFRCLAAPSIIVLNLGPAWALWSGVDWRLALSVSGACLAVSGATVALWAAFRRAYTAEAEARAAMEAAVEAAEAAVDAKSSFVAMVSHELRTPLSGVIAAGGQLTTEGPDRLTRQAAEVVVDSGRFMQALLDDLLDLAKLEAGRMTVEAVDFDIGQMVWAVERHWTAAARAVGTPLQLTSASGLPLRVSGDPTRIRQILNNLLSNALKFTGSEGVSWTVDACAGPDCAVLGGMGLSVRVTDTGPGMTAEQLDRLFTAFDQTSESVARTHGGTGLGLAVSRELARRMGGDLSVESEPGVGSTFVLHLPLKAAGSAEPASAPSEPESGDAAARKGTRVLVVDDHPINRRTLELLLEPAGVEVTAVESGAEALERLAAGRFDAVLSDLHMPGMDGLALARAVRSGTGPNRNVPVIAVTGADSDTERARCEAAGMTGYVAKPISAPALYAALEAALAVGSAEADDLARAAPRAA